MRRLWSIILPCLLLTACGGDEFEYSRYQAFFIFDNQQHLDPTLSSAMNPLAPGIYCRITTSGNQYFLFTNNQGQSSRQTMNAIDKQRSCILGIYNETGIYVGYGTLNDPPTFYAYDALCPNCYKETGLMRNVLSVNSSGLASCGRCKRTYDMNNMGIITQGEAGEKLIRYRAATTGPNGILSVNN
ncbi:MAG: hypothetical protein ILA07_08765 [Prevotella sp.]|nr:hypothetical protein [Prevotella sp.]